MEENKELNLDTEYKRYLQIMRPYLGQLLDQDVIEICKAWIQRLSKCKASEKNLRNKYVFTLCYQLSKGILDEPFIRYPCNNELSPLCDEFDSDESSTEVECLVINPDNTHTKVLYKNLKTPHTITESESPENNTSFNSNIYVDENNLDVKRSLMCCNGQDFIPNYIHQKIKSDELEDRANNVILKLRQMKTENIMLHEEIQALKSKSKNNYYNYSAQTNKHKIDIATSAYIHAPESNTTLNSLRCKLQKVQHSRDNLIESISNLQDTLDNFNELKRHEVSEIEAKYKLEIVKIKTNIKDEVSKAYDNKLDDVKRQYEDEIKKIQCKHQKEIEALNLNVDEITLEKNKLLQCKDMEILRLNGLIEDLKLQCTAETNKTTPNINLSLDNSNDYGKRLHKMEKLKNRSAKIYEAKIANLQREKHLIECSLQLQLIKQRAQVVEEATNENQTELTTALEKLEGKYKEITANVQATAVQRRIQDQMALESLIKTVCDIPNEGKVAFNSQIQDERPLFKKRVNKQTHDQALECDNLPLSEDNKFESIIVGDQHLEEKNEGKYYLNTENFSELLERAYIPQKDTNNVSVKSKN